MENTLVFDTLRKGFPSSNIEVWDNYNNEDEKVHLIELCEKGGYHHNVSFKRWHHADWIEMIVNTHDDEVVILDPDIIFYDNCQEFDFPTLIAGRFVPTIWNEWFGAISYERLHTSFLQIRDCKELRKQLGEVYPPMLHPVYNDYTPLNPYRPAVNFYQGYPMAWDTCATIFHMVGGSCFTPNELSRYSHVNSSAFQEEMLERVKDKDSFRLQHHKAREKDYEWFRDFYKAEDKYYMEMNALAKGMVQQRQENYLRKN